MVTIEEIQVAYYMVAATGVLVAAIFYILNIRETMKNRRATFANNMQQNFITEEWQARFMETMNMQWSDFEDFKKKYDSSVNLKSYAKRHSVLVSYDNLGQQFRFGVIDMNTFTDIWALGAVMAWWKFKPIIEGYRRWEYPKNAFSDFENLANALQKRLVGSDPDFMNKLNTFFTTPSVDQ